MKYMIIDKETQNHKKFKRVANPFIEDNWVVMRGFKVQGDAQCTAEYFPTPEDVKPMHIPDDVQVLVGHNIKFDLLYIWHEEELKAFFKRGGKIWDTQYVEYLLEGMQQKYHMNSLDSIVEKYGGRTKIDEVKILWNAGMLTADIDVDLLTDYLIGTEEEGRNSGDIGNTELVFLGQVKRAVSDYPISLLPMIQTRMDGLCCTIEMEYNGLKIDVKEAAKRTKELEQELQQADKDLEQYIPEMPEGLVFNWASNVHCSCLIFGGTIKYKKSAPYMDDKTGELARLKASESWPLFDNEPVNPEECDLVAEVYSLKEDGKVQDLYKSGKKKGMGKFKKVPVLGEIKTKIQDFYHELPGYTQPLNEWKGKLTDGKGEALYATNADVISSLGNRDIPFLKLMSKRQDILKDLGTYYVRYDPKKKEYVGMLTCVDPKDHIVHHSINHTSTVTSRLSSSNPNLQNVPRADTSEVKKMFVSRFDNGRMIEADYSQLEVVVQGMLSKDKNLIKDLHDKVDFHCKRVALKHGISYEEAVDRCKNEDHPEYNHWKAERTKAKIFSFQRAYGAGAFLIAESTGMSIDEVKDLIEAEEIEYSGVVEFNSMIEKAVKSSAKPFNDPSRGYKTFRKGFWQAPTGTVYTWRSYDAPQFLQDKGIEDTFKPTELKNYPVQGTGGELVQMVLGKLWRHYVSTDNYNNRSFLCNTVHDCVWVDSSEDVHKEVAKNLVRIMEGIPEYLLDTFNIDALVPFPVDVEAGPDMYVMSHIE